MIGKPTYLCKKCGYTCRVSSEVELSNHKTEHSKKCDGILEKATGDCILTALENSKKRGWLFCYAQVPGDIRGQTFIHVWNEGKGAFKNTNGNIKIVTKNLEDKEVKDFVFDLSHNSKTVMLRDDYYESYGINPEEVKRIEAREVVERVLKSRSENKGDFEWLE